MKISSPARIRQLDTLAAVAAAFFLSQLVLADGNATSSFPERVLWGDAHVHTSLSVDSYAFGNTSLGPKEAYRFARGDSVVMVPGMEVRIGRPLDFLIVADHSDGMGALNDMVERAGHDFLDSEAGRSWFEELAPIVGTKGVQTGEELYRLFGAQLPDYGSNESEPYGTAAGARYESDEFRRSVWNHIVESAEDYNQPGEFTTFAGYEWTSGKTGTMLHRVVVFEDGPERTMRILPLTVAESDNPEKLWEHMARYKEVTGGDVLAIPHNPNMSNGRMFLPLREDGSEFDRQYASIRREMEPLLEVTQVKGDSETHPLISPRDEFADFETWHLTDSDVRYEYARSALKLGLELGRQLGVNPYQFGMIGSTDAHTSLTSVQEDEFLGKFVSLRPSPDRITNARDFKFLASKWSASGLAAVWSTGNTREEIFAAMKRREVYATTGPRITLRFFGGWAFEEEDILGSSDARVRAAYEGGVPMGGVLQWREGVEAPRFLVGASKDPDGYGLERIQIVKGWLDARGETHEAVHDVARKSPQALDGAAHLFAHWVDADFDASSPAFYYIRVLEVPSPRWTTLDARKYKFEPPADVPAEIRERAYSSPIWYEPGLAEVSPD